MLLIYKTHYKKLFLRQEREWAYLILKFLKIKENQTWLKKPKIVLDIFINHAQIKIALDK
jgi:hypothetical protein